MQLWCKANKLVLNIDNSCYIIFKPDASVNNEINDLKLSVNFDSKTIQKVSSTKFLGVQIDENLD